MQPNNNNRELEDARETLDSFYFESFLYSLVLYEISQILNT